jgi:hypothetical protein
MYETTNQSVELSDGFVQKSRGKRQTFGLEVLYATLKYFELLHTYFELLHIYFELL